jgi:hypothetical protein
MKQEGKGMSNIYENILEEFLKRDCKLLTTKEEHIEIVDSSKKKCNYKLNYIASCGHNNWVFYNVFKSRDTGIICPNCKHKKNSLETKEKIKNKELSKIYNIEQEFEFIKDITELLENDFEFIKAFDGCKSDIIFKPKNIIDNLWVGIQVKTTKKRHLTYGFHMNNTNYRDCLVLFYCCEDESMWIVPENIISNKIKVSIGYKKSKYNIYKTCKTTICEQLKKLYVLTTKFAFDHLNLPTNIYQKRELEFRKFRESKIDFIDFHYDNMEGSVYDFKIFGLKIQEKVTKCSNGKDKYSFNLCKNNGKTNDGKRLRIQYDLGDNDYYWLNCDSKTFFFVVPEIILFDKYIIGNNKKSLFFKITAKEILHEKSSWIQPYMFNYENIDKERLLQVFNKAIREVVGSIPTRSDK